MVRKIIIFFSMSYGHDFSGHKEDHPKIRKKKMRKKDGKNDRGMPMTDGRGREGHPLFTG